MKYCLALLMLLISPVSAAADIDEAEQIVSFVKKLDKHVTWPKDRSAEGNGKLFVIAAVGKSPATDKLKKLNGEKTPGGKQFKVRVVTPDLLPSNGHVLIVTTPDEKTLKTIVKKLHGSGTLTIGPGDSTGQAGTMITYFNETVENKSRLRFQINIAAIKAEGIEIDSRLLEDESIIVGK
ncbi:MAG: YfiR family protein [FCB group bacterium]|nr:YfiR family protein [FCB group bacterium]